MLASLVAVHAAHAVDDDVYGESALPAFKPPEVVPELELALPPLPSGDQLIPLDMDAKGSAFSVLLDPASLTVGEDGIVRYTVVMRSKAGAENIVYEGMRCDRKQYRRYAYASGSEFRPVAGSEWKFVRKIPRDRYRAILLDDYFCPLPRSDGARKILQQLEGKRRRIQPFE